MSYITYHLSIFILTLINAHSYLPSHTQAEWYTYLEILKPENFHGVENGLRKFAKIQIVIQCQNLKIVHIEHMLWKNICEVFIVQVLSNFRTLVCLVFLLMTEVCCVYVQFFVKLQYHKQQQSIHMSAHGEVQQPAADADNDVLMRDDAAHIDSSNVDVFSKPEACLFLYYYSNLMASFSGHPG